MFLISALFVFIVVYGCSAALAETVFTSEAERRLPVATRVGFGYFLSLLYFSAAWLFMSITQAWVLGVLLLALYAYGKFGGGLTSEKIAHIRAVIWQHCKVLGAFLIVANIFFIPLHLSGNYGPFTEGGGDITIYSDVAKKLADGGLTATGLENSASLNERLTYIKYLTSHTHSERYQALDEALINPPYADYQANRLSFALHYNPIAYASSAQFAFLSGENNYPVYFGIQAFLYACILLSVWGFFRRFGIMLPIIAILIVGSGHSLVSSFYNMYASQASSITLLALILGALPSIRLFSVAGARTYGVGSAYVGVGYVHFLPIILPFLVVASFKRFYPAVTGNAKEGVGGKANPMKIISRYAALGIFVVFFAIFILIWAKGSIDVVSSVWHGFTGNMSLASTNTFMGDRVPVFSVRWFSYLFGIASQQHFHPYATENLFLTISMVMAILAGLLAFAMGLFLIFKLRKPIINGDNPELAHFAVIFLAALLSIVAYGMMIQSSQYTQAKGAQYLLLCVYISMLLPLILLYQQSGKEKISKKFKTIYVNVFVCFIVFLFIPRMAFAYRLAFQSDRGSIMEASYFSEAARIKAEDKDAFVIFEPRKSGDLYLSSQPFSGYKMVPTKHLVLQKINRATQVSKRMIASEFITPGDLPHLWRLAAVKTGAYAYTWKAERLISHKSPGVYFFGDDYEAQFGIKPRSGGKTDASDMGMFSYLRNGAAMIYLPPGGPYSVEVKVSPRDEKRYSEMVREISKRAAAGEFGATAAMGSDGQFVTLAYHYPLSDAFRLMPVAKYGDEFWFNARLAGQEFAKD